MYSSEGLQCEETVYEILNIFMDSLKIQGFAESWFPKISWDFLIFLYNVTNTWNKRKYLN